MAEIVLFHHVGGLTSGVVGLAQQLREAGHTVHTPDLFGGRTFTDLHEAMAYVDCVGEETFAERAAEIVAPMPRDLVYGGLSMGVAEPASKSFRGPGRGLRSSSMAPSPRRGGAPRGPRACRPRPT